jgi:hypothetical protein
MRALYRRDKSLFIDLVEQAAVMDVVLVGGLGDDEDTVWGARRLLKEMLLDVAWARGLPLDPDIGEIDLPQLEQRRKAVLTAEGLPLECPVCHRPASTALALADVPRRGLRGEAEGRSEACLDKASTSWKFANERKQYRSGLPPQRLDWRCAGGARWWEGSGRDDATARVALGGGGGGAAGGAHRRHLGADHLPDAPSD